MPADSDLSGALQGGRDFALPRDAAGLADNRARPRHRLERGTLALFSIVAGYVAAAAVATWTLGRPISLSALALGYLLLVLPIPLFLLVLGGLRVVRAQSDAGENGAGARAQGRALVASWRRWRAEHGLWSAATVLMLPLFMGGFTSFKFLIPAIQPFAAWDERLARWDRLIHGVDPWLLLRPLFEAPVVTFALNALYYPVWFCVSLGCWVFVATRHHPRRQQFLVTFLLLWILLGTVGGAAMSSAGPILYDRATGDAGRFGGLLQDLEAADRDYPLITLVARDRLWAAYESGVADVGTGISAMPSLHVAIVTLCALFAWTCGRRAGMVMTAYAAVILVASVHLGWHYALDGYVSIAATVAIWLACGRVLGRADRSGDPTGP